jgi:hypothetical protein
MSEGREREVAEVFVALAGGLAQGADVQDFLSGLTADCARLLDIASAGLLLADRRGVLNVVAASSEKTRSLEIFQLQREQGPCLDCYHGGHSVSVPSLLADASRWPQFAEAATNAGFASVHALPMRLRDNVLGALGLFGTSIGALNDNDLLLGQAFADVASVAMVQSSAAIDEDALTQQLQGALESRVVLEQAKGILAERGSIELEEAFVRLQRYSRDHNYRMGGVAQALVSRQLPPEQLLAHSTNKDSRRLAAKRPR